MMPKATMRRNKRRMMTIGVQFIAGRREFAQIISHSLLYRPSVSLTEIASVFYSGDLSGRHISRKGILRLISGFVLEFGTIKICWSQESVEAPIVKKRAYQIIDLHFPEFKAK